jgi:replicative DNA helicase
VRDTSSVEVSVLSAMLQDPDAPARTIGILEPQMFSLRRHAVLFQVMSSMVDRERPIDAITLAQEIRSTGRSDEVGGLGYIAELIGAVPTSRNIEHYAKIVKESWLLRRLVVACNATVADATDVGDKTVAEIIDDAQARLLECVSTNRSGDAAWTRDTVPDALDDIERLHKAEGGITGTPTGFYDIDFMTGGLQPGEVTLIAARPSMGKTAWMMNVVANVATNPDIEGVVPVYSLEMGRESLTQRLLLSEARVPKDVVARGRTTADHWKRLATASEIISKAPILIDDTPVSTILDLRARARTVAARGKVALIVIDYLQLMTGSGRTKSREQEVSEISRGIKAMARELNVPVIALSQLSRQPESRPDKRPMLSDLRESGSLEQDADVVAFLFRPEYYFGPRDDNGNSLVGVSQFIISKQRNGAVGHVDLRFTKECARFDSIERRPTSGVA